MIEKNQHLTTQILFNFNQGNLSNEDYMTVLTHISDCERCAGLFADSFKAADTLTAPHYLKDNIMEQVLHTKDAEKLVTSALLRKSSINRQWLLYSLRVSAAMLGALFIIFSGLFHKDFSINAENIPVVDMLKITEFNKNLNEFSTKIMNPEVTNHAEKEK